MMRNIAVLSLITKTDVYVWNNRQKKKQEYLSDLRGYTLNSYLNNVIMHSVTVSLFQVDILCSLWILVNKQRDKQTNINILYA